MGYQFGTDRPKLDVKLQGIGKFVATPGQSSHYFVFPNNCMFNGVQVIADNANLGDNLSLTVEYPYQESWKRYKKFGKSWYIYKDNILEIVLFPTYPEQGMRAKFIYDNTGNANINFVVNLFVYSDQLSVDTANGAEGEDW